MSAFLKKLSVLQFLATVFQVQAQMSGAGDATWFVPGLGACGKTHNSNDFVVALVSDFHFCLFCNVLIRHE
jgi:hypothetical protein